MKVPLVSNLTFEDFTELSVNLEVTKSRSLADNDTYNLLFSLIAKELQSPVNTCCYGLIGTEGKAIDLYRYLENSEYNYDEYFPLLQDSLLANFEISSKQILSMTVEQWWQLVDFCEGLPDKDEDIILGKLKENLVYYKINEEPTLGFTPSLKLKELSLAVRVDEEYRLERTTLKEISLIGKKESMKIKVLNSNKERGYIEMLSTYQLAKLESSPVKNGPCIISEDIMRLFKLYDANKAYETLPSIKNEIKFLWEAYPNMASKYLQSGEFFPLENMDIIWAYSEIEERWDKIQYFNEKAGHLKYLRDVFINTGLYKYYEHLEPFQLLEGKLNVEAVIKSPTDMVPLAYFRNEPITEFHRKMNNSASKSYNQLPEVFSCFGCNFTKKEGEVIKRTTCGLALYKYAEFDMNKEGFVITPENIKLYDFKQLLISGKAYPLKELGSREKLKESVKSDFTYELISKLGFGDRHLALDRFFTNTQENKLAPYLGDTDFIKAVFELMEKRKV